MQRYDSISRRGYLKPKIKQQHQTPAAATSYDPDSGLVYHETIVKRQALSVSWDDWYLAMKEKSMRRPRPFQGSDSLLNMSIQKTIRHIRTLDPETLRALPPSIADMIWKTIRRDARESFNIWKLFVEGGLGNQSTRYFGSIAHHQEPLVETFLKMNSPNFIWMVDIELVNLNRSAADLKTLSVLRNLQTLAIYYKASAKATQWPFNDSIIHAMTHKANQEGAFPRLEMLFVENDHQITANAFEPLSRLPALRLFGVLATGVRTSDGSVWRQNGWKKGKNLGFAEYADERAGISNLRARYERDHVTYADIVKGYIQQHYSKGQSNLPHMSCSLGNHKPQLTDRCTRDWGLVFERDWQPRLSTVAGTESKAAEAVTDAASPDDVRSRKRRKLKTGKRIVFDSMLDDL